MALQNPAHPFKKTKENVKIKYIGKKIKLSTKFKQLYPMETRELFPFNLSKLLIVNHILILNKQQSINKKHKDKPT